MRNYELSNLMPGYEELKSNEDRLASVYMHISQFVSRFGERSDKGETDIEKHRDKVYSLLVKEKKRLEKGLKKRKKK